MLEKLRDKFTLRLAATVAVSVAIVLGLARFTASSQKEAENVSKKHADIAFHWPPDFEDGGALAAQFVWDPLLNGTTTRQVLAGAYNQTLQQPALVVFGSGAWYLRYGEETGGVDAWRRTMDVVSQSIEASKRPKGWLIANHVYVAPVARVVPTKLSDPRRNTLTPEAITTMNSYMRLSQIPLFNAWDAMLIGQQQQTEDGLHYSAALEKRAINVLLNRVCNQITVSNNIPPFRTTCCFAYPPPRWPQITIALFVIMIIPGLIIIKNRLILDPTPLKSDWFVSYTPSMDVLWNMIQFGSILLVMYVCDRTPLFDKIHKHFVGWVFALLLFSTIAVPSALSVQVDSQSTFLSRAQTDEWKGWMQLIILAYHVTNASGISGIYNPVRVLVAMYLFMTGYGHCAFFMAKADFGLKRLTAVLLRTNVLAVSLAYVMGSSYMDYYFAPLSSAWVLIVWLTMRVMPSTNRQLGMLLLKIIVSASIVFTINRLHLWPFSLLLRLGVRWVQREWEFRFGTDIFIVYIGMIVAAIVRLHGQNLQNHPRWPLVYRWSILCSILAIFGYFWFELTRKDKFAYNYWHPYISFIPILGFVVLRNASASLRARSSRAMIFIGRISLELFIAQYHLFLAADTKAVLILLHPRWWLSNLLFVSLIFVGMCQLLATTSAVICNWLMSPITSDKQNTLQNPTDIPMSEILNSRPAALDRLASDPPATTRLVNWFINFASLLDNLAIRWFLGLATLLYLNNKYYF
ncbi:Cas1p-domain-containing protein [Coemansia reversa NRRL 1564]|uniref:Cas1p-domain-containing protein n=1 Tax=Coemansia reversa (strain ATCC 12441 / NRRL 1564) TaxID=763665 RepID=A0A2G5B127_COERN|nr:Cas1p-domain-containing protein [Coemansia reversa NRRL 1564]|eukprot:PIA12710.1 Cas1p-domain-containing protein [Coemansia reversa NRRL 1564]